MARQPTVLLVEDTQVLARTYLQYLSKEPYAVTHVDDGAKAREAIARHPPDVVLLDLHLPDMNGLDILREISEKGTPSAVIIITAHGSVATAVEAMRYGAVDFIAKPFTADRLVVTVRNTIERQQLAEIVETYRERIDRDRFCGFIGASLAMQNVYRIIESAAPSQATVFVTGESGTGKEVCADAIHRLSPRAEKPFISLNCAAIPRDLIESEVFGHVKGAFTGAVSDRSGAASQADGGTLFLDEICEMNMALQSKLLRFIQTQTFQRVGANKIERVNVRFVAATNRDPMEEVQAGRFREDLYYRMHVIPVHLPPLRERDEDVILIARALLAEFSKQEGKAFTAFSDEAEAAMMAYHWPGNVRELQNVIRNAVVLNQGDRVTEDMLPAPLLDGTEREPIRDRQDPVPSESAPAADAKSSGSDDLSALSKEIRPLAEVERAHIERAIALCGGNIGTAATLLGISRATIYRKKASWT